MIRKISLLLTILVILPCQSPHAQQTGIIQADGVVVLFDQPFRAAAEETLLRYPKIKMEVEDVFGWQLKFPITILLVNNRERFLRMTSHGLVVAYAVPEKQLMVIDYTRTNTDPHSLGTIMKHELCHLTLHHRIAEARLPRWLDEGVCQWVSDGIPEIVMNRKRSLLEGAVLSKQLFSIRSLSEDFPESDDSLLLAYEESKSLVEFISNEFGSGGLLELLNHLAAGDEIEAAVRSSFSVSFDELERRWLSHLRKKTTWFTYLANNIYGFLFLFGALITVCGFVRVLIKKKRYRDQPWPDA